MGKYSARWWHRSLRLLFEHKLSCTCISEKKLKVSHNLTRKAGVGMYYTYVVIIPTILLFVCFLALPSLFHFSIKQLFFILV